MTSIARSRGDIVVGVDTHKDTHVAVVIDGVGGRLGDLTVAAKPAGYDRLVWAAGLGQPVVEGTGSYGAGLASFLRRHGAKVIEVNRPSRRADRRANGKSDTLDAEHAAREVLAGTATAVPKTADGAIETLRLVKIARDTAMKAHTSAMIALKATLVTGDDELRAELEHLTNFKLIEACAALTPEEPLQTRDHSLPEALTLPARSSSSSRPRWCLANRSRPRR